MLKIKNLNIRFEEEVMVSKVSFAMKQGEVLGIVGESGSGKTLTALSIAGLLPEDAIVSGEINFEEKNLLSFSPEERRHYKGKAISVVFQDPMNALNPVYKIGRQVDEVLRLHTELLPEERKKEIMETFKLTDLQNPEEVYDKYPHQLSGGMIQRVMIAMAVICRPKLIIADEPTTALDVLVQKEILKLLKKINQVRNTSILFISHDLNVIREITDKVLVMNKGEIIEEGLVQEIFKSPQKEYTKKLIDSIVHGEKVKTVPSENKVLEVKDVSIYYKGKKGQREYFLRNINLEIFEGEILGFVGRSGIGKTSFSMAIMGFHKGYTGEIIHYTKMPQMIFQNAYSSLNPVKKVGWILEEPLKNKREMDRKQRKNAVLTMLEKVGLSEEYVNRYPRQLSGGQRQRVSIAYALMLGSKFIIADEPVSALDVTIQSQILELLLNLQKEFSLSLLFISHDESVIKKMCDRVMKI